MLGWVAFNVSTAEEEGAGWLELATKSRETLTQSVETLVGALSEYYENFREFSLTPLVVVQWTVVSVVCPMGNRSRCCLMQLSWLLLGGTGYRQNKENYYMRVEENDISTYLQIIIYNIAEIFHCNAFTLLANLI